MNQRGRKDRDRKPKSVDEKDRRGKWSKNEGLQNRRNNSNRRWRHYKTSKWKLQ